MTNNVQVSGVSKKFGINIHDINLTELAQGGNMRKALIIYRSTTGNTEAMAESIEEALVELRDSGIEGF